MAYHSQMIKGLLEGCILKIVSNEESYGYKITEKLVKHGFLELNEGSVYPVLVRLEKKKLLRSVLKDSPMGPKRKYFYLTSEGEVRLQEFMMAWNEIKGNVDRIMEAI